MTILTILLTAAVAVVVAVRLRKDAYEEPRLSFIKHRINLLK